MKEEYTVPNIDIVAFESKDIITASGILDGKDEPEID